VVAVSNEGARTEEARGLEDNVTRPRHLRLLPVGPPPPDGPRVVAGRLGAAGLYLTLTALALSSGQDEVTHMTIPRP